MKNDIVDVVAKQIEITKIKLFVFVAGIGGSWAFVSVNFYKIGFLLIFVLGAFVLFCFGVAVNLTRIGKLYDELEKLKGKK